jgi:hypothetical protein
MPALVDVHGDQAVRLVAWFDESQAWRTRPNNQGYTSLIRDVSGAPTSASQVWHRT